MGSARQVAVITRIPRPGRTKQRLARAVGDGAAAALHEAFLRDELATIGEAGFAPLVVHDPAESESEVALLEDIAERATRVGLPGESLASDLLAAFHALCPRGAAAVVSSDAPQLQGDEIARAFDALQSADVVLGPCPDGGYWLVAMREPHDVFTGIEMGTAGVFEATRKRVAELGLRLGIVGSLDDVDTFADLAAVAPLLRRRGETRAMLAELMSERDDLVPPLPRRLHLELTNRCNSLCRTCFRTSEPEPDRDMTLAEATGVLDQLPELESVALQVNGEPLLYPHLVDVIAHAKARDVFVELNTNAIALRGPRAEALLESGLDRLHVSLDAATRETYALVRGVDAFDTVVENVRAWATRRRELGSGPSLVLWMTATRHNIHELPDLVDLAASVQSEAVFLQRLVFFGSGLARRQDSLHGELGVAAEGAIAEAERRAGALGIDLFASGGHAPADMLSLPDDDAPWRDCRRPWESAVVMADGRAAACCLGTFHAPGSEITMGDAFDGRFDATWRGSRYQKLRVGLLTGTGASFCHQCGLDWSL